MKVYHGLSELPTFDASVITIGSFDGVHQGHRSILSRLHHLAKQYSVPSVVITFHPHPRKIINPKASIPILNTPEEKLQLLSNCGVQEVIFIHFDEDFAHLSPKDYIHQVLIDHFHPKAIVIGYDHQFGLNRSGSVADLKQELQGQDVEIIVIEKQEAEEVAVSSTKVRQYIRDGRFNEAVELLGGPYPLSGNVIYGHQVGQSIGYPTANIQVADTDKMIPADGIFAAKAVIHGQTYEGMLYIGKRPSVNPSDTSVIEINLFSFEADIYDQPIEVWLYHKIRNDAHFEDLALLSAQLADDERETKAYFAQASATLSPFESMRNTTVAILNYNGLAHLKTYLPSVVEHSDTAQLLVIDNGSTDESVSYLREHFPLIEIVVLDKNYGFAGGYNHGLKDVRTPYVVLLNSDVAVSAKWLEALESAIAAPDVGAVQPKILSDRQRSKFEYAGAAGGLLDKLGYPFCLGRVFDTCEEDTGQYDEARAIFWASGAALMTRTALFLRVGGFDERFFAHNEEIDLCWRYQRLGYRIESAPTSVVYHLGGGTLAYSSSRKVYLNFRNNLSMLGKNLPQGELIPVLLARLLLDGIAGLRFLISGKIGSFAAVVRAHISFYLNIPHIIAQRRHQRNSAKSDGKKLKKIALFPKSIVWQYYIKGRKTYQRIQQNG